MSSLSVRVWREALTLAKCVIARTREREKIWSNESIPCRFKAFKITSADAQPAFNFSIQQRKQRTPARDHSHSRNLKRRKQNTRSLYYFLDQSMGLFSLFRRDKKRIANESFCETSDKTDAHEATREHLPPRQVKKRKLTDGETDSTKIASGALYSSDIIFHILGFFVSDSGSQGEIDGTSLKNAMLVCHQWKKVANSKALWSLPTRAFPSITDSTKRSLLLRDTSFDENSNSVSASPSNARLPLIGFQKLSSEKAKFGDEATIFRARNRATGEVNLLSISPRSKKTSEMLNQVFEAHFFQHSSFCGGDGLTAAFMPKSFPRGVATINGRVTRWYEASKNAEIFPNPVFTSHLKSFRNGWEEIHGDDSDTNDFMGKRFRLCYCFDHLKKVEQDVAADENSEAPNLVCWSMVVDWVIEIMQCFDLEDRIAFHTMALFQQFMTKTDVSHLHFLANGVYQVLTMRFHRERSSL